jgi:hypothetical protein
MHFELSKWTPRRKALYNAAQDAGFLQRDARPSWNFLLRESVSDRPSPDLEAVPREIPMGTYIKQKEWLSLRDHGHDGARDGDTFAVDRLTYSGEVAFYIAGDKQVFVAAPDAPA